MRDKQFGGIVSFVIVGIVLAGLFVGGVFLSKQQARVARESNTSTPTIAQPENRSGNERQQNGSNGTADRNQQGTAPQQPRSNTPSPQAPIAPNRAPTTGPSDLPETGPADTVAQVGVIGVLAFAVTRFVQSRRSLNDLNARP